ncbi:MAG: YbbR-like domain-containing protein [Spirochaetaceae bacterium]
MKGKRFLARLLHNWPAKALSLAAAILLLVFHDISELEERFFSVPLELELPEGYVPASSFPDNVRVSLRGESDEIFRILEEDIRAYVDLTEHDSAGEFLEPIRVERQGTASGIEPLEIGVEPLEVAITLEETMQRVVDVEPSLTGFPPTGYELTQYRISPSTVEIEGPSSHVESIEEITTEDIDLAGRREDFSVRVRLQRPDPLVSFLGGDVVEFRGIIEEAVVLHTFDPVETVVLGLDPQLEIEGTLPSGTVRVQGRQLEVEELDPDQVQLIIDASSITSPGTYRLSARPDVPQGLIVLRYEPTEIEVTVTEVQE